MAGENGEITAAIEQLRSQLTAVQEGSREARLRFVVTEGEMEVLVEVTKAGGGSAGVRLGPVSAGADGRGWKGASHPLRARAAVGGREVGGRAPVAGPR